MKRAGLLLRRARPHLITAIQINQYRVNHRIRAREVRVIVASTSEQLGVMKIQDALRAAQQLGLDLVEVAATANPPVCRIVDYGKFKYEIAKHDKDRKSNAASRMKEIKFRVHIDKHDYATKMRHAEEFLDKGNKVRCLLQFRGREMAHKEIGMELMKKIETDLAEMGHPESPAKLMGKNVFLTIVPLPAGKRKRHFFSDHQLALKETEDVEKTDDDADDVDDADGDDAEAKE
jgi:translation initiation factor IF-3